MTTRTLNIISSFILGLGICVSLLAQPVSRQEMILTQARTQALADQVADVRQTVAVNQTKLDQITSDVRDIKATTQQAFYLIISVVGAWILRLISPLLFRRRANVLEE